MFQKIKKIFLSASADIYDEEINYRNECSLHAFAIVGVVVSGAMIVFGYLMREILTFNTEFMMIFVYFLFLLGLTKYLLKTNIKQIRLIFYIAMTPIMLIAILMGTFLDPYQPSITIMVFMCVLPLFILDKPYRICLYITLIAIVYTICCFLSKDIHLFAADFIDLGAFYCLGIGINFYTLKDRLENVENYVLYREKSQMDTLCGIFNRGAGTERIERHIQNKRHGLFCIIDIDDFKTINDTYGHSVGDIVLQNVANILNLMRKQGDVCFRMGGDEFIIYYVGYAKTAEQKKLCATIMNQVQAIEIPNLPDLQVSVSLGCCYYQSADYKTLVNRADKALYEVKRKGKHDFVIYKA